MAAKVNPFFENTSMLTKCGAPIYKSGADKSDAEAVLFFINSPFEPAKNHGGFFKPFGERLGLVTYSADILPMQEPMVLPKEKVVIKKTLDFVDQIDSEYSSDVPKFLCGQGLGSLIALKMLLQRPDFFRAGLLVSPIFEFGHKVSALQKAGLFFKKATNGSQAYMGLPDLAPPNNDKSMPQHLSLGSYFQTLTTQHECAMKSTKLKTPMLWLQGEEDQIADKDTTYRIFNDMKKVKHKKLMTVPEGGPFLLTNSQVETSKEIGNFLERLI